MAKYLYLEGVMFFPFIFEATDKFDRYSVALGLEGDQVKHAKNLNLKVKQNDNKMDGLPYVQLKSNFKPVLFGADGKEYDGPTMLQNGSKAEVRVSQKPYDNKFGKGITTYMNAVRIIDPIEYVPEGAKSDKALNALNDDIPF